MAMSNMPAVESDLGKAKTANTPLLAMREIFTKTGPPQGAASWKPNQCCNGRAEESETAGGCCAVVVVSVVAAAVMVVPSLS